MIFNILPLLARRLLFDNRVDHVLYPTEYGLSHPVPMWFFGVLTGISVLVFIVTIYYLIKYWNKW